MQATVLGLGLQSLTLSRAIAFVLLVRLVRLASLLRELYLSSVLHGSRASPLMRYVPVAAVYACILLYTLAGIAFCVVLFLFLRCWWCSPPPWLPRPPSHGQSLTNKKQRTHKTKNQK